MNLLQREPSFYGNEFEKQVFLQERIAVHEHRLVHDFKGTHLFFSGRSPSENDICLQSNDYLSISSHQTIIDTQVASLKNQAQATVMSGVFLQDSDIHRVFSRRLADFMGGEAGILCQSGWAANVGLLQSIASPNVPVYIDMLAHTSLWEGIKSAGATARPFRHNSALSLEKQIKKSGQGIVVFDTVYSTTGDIAPLKEMVEIANRYDCILLVDESHSLGTHGPEGRGLVYAEGLQDQVHFVTASLAKAFSGRAGFITCPKDFFHYFAVESWPAIFSSTLLNHEVAALNETLDVIKKEGWRRSRLARNAAYFKQQLIEAGYNVTQSESQIIALETGDDYWLVLLRDALQERGIFASPFVWPAAPKNRSLLRFSVSSELTLQQIDYIVDACREIKEVVCMAQWPSTRRMEQATQLAA